MTRPIAVGEICPIPVKRTISPVSVTMINASFVHPAPVSPVAWGLRGIVLQALALGAAVTADRTPVLATCMSSIFALAAAATVSVWSPSVNEHELSTEKDGEDDKREGGKHCLETHFLLWYRI